MNRVLFFLSLCLFSLGANAFVADSSKVIYSSSAVHWVKLADTHADTLTFHNLDTTANNFQIFNPIHTNINDNARIYLGNLGLATTSLIFQDQTKWGFDMGRHSFDPYLKQIDDLKFYRTLSPYTNLYYIWNKKKEQLFSFSFAQNIGPRVNYAFNFTRLVSVGDYARQEADHLNYDLSTWYTSKNRKYQAFAAIINSSLVLQENGGIKNDSIFRVASAINSEFEPAYLNNASNRIDDKHYFLKQTYAFGPTEVIKIDTQNITRIRPTYRLFHEIRYNNRKDQYLETPIDTGVYANIYLDSINTGDVYQMKHFQTRFGIEHYKHTLKSHRINSTIAYLRYDNILYRNDIYAGLSIAAEQTYQLSKRVEILAKAQQGIVMDYSNNTMLDAKAKFYSKNDSSAISLSYAFSDIDVDVFSQSLISNHHTWSNGFKKVQHNILKANYENTKRKFEVGITLGNVNNKVYYDSLMMPQQLKSYQYVQLQVKKAFKLGKFHLLNQIYMQQNTEKEIMRLPYLFTYQSLYFQSYAFKKALNLRTGFDVRYYPKTQSYNYDAASSQFYLSNKSFGDYPIIDFFLTASLKRAVLMLKVDHLNQGFWNKGYYMVEGYPLPDRVVKIGLRWAFYD